ncbi:hemerythrin domain-containing protein [Serinicoccus kebangsaanensis]|uniref:hemerythrin domain-containing protein n=1 Tax=Serinicoccus kebangsaanensis TaxID=2602069 RepID=UPI00124D9C57|nr:hemerythrin domain-containing protein [Serinicoccus kebangsaanensis]
MLEDEKERMVAWGRELRAVHDRLREALRVTREAGEAPRTPEQARELLLFCRGFCAALTGHHEGEDRMLFPAIAERHPELRDTLAKLSQDHSMIGYLLTGLGDAVDGSATPEELDRHLEGLAAIMESHFRFEERALLGILDTLDLDADAQEVLGPL